MENSRPTSPGLPALACAVEAREAACREAARLADPQRLTALLQEGEQLRDQIGALREDLSRQYRQVLEDSRRLQLWAAAQNDNAT
jgi:hypothetical protein